MILAQQKAMMFSFLNKLLVIKKPLVIKNTSTAKAPKVKPPVRSLNGSELPLPKNIGYA
jgi:hypothetical protein